MYRKIIWMKSSFAKAVSQEHSGVCCNTRSSVQFHPGDITKTPKRFCKHLQRELHQLYASTERPTATRFILMTSSGKVEDKNTLII